MKLSEKIWIEKLAQTSLTKPTPEMKNIYVVQEATTIFLEELCFLVVEYINHFNEVVSSANQLLSWSLFKLMQPRSGLIVTRGNDKLVISDHGKSVHVKMVHTCLQSERLHQSLYFEPKISDLGTINWRCANDSQYVNPELVARNYLSTFLVSGCQEAIQSYPRLVAVSAVTAK